MIFEIAFFIQEKILADDANVFRIVFGRAIISSQDSNSNCLVPFEQAKSLLFTIEAIHEVVVDLLVLTSS